MISRDRRWAILFSGSPVLADRHDRGGQAVDDGGLASSRVTGAIGGHDVDLFPPGIRSLSSGKT